MSFAHLGYPVVSAPNMGPQATVTSRSSPKSPPGSPCCETGRPVMTDPMTGQTVCSCQYGPASAALYNYPRVPGLPEALYNSAAMAAQLQFAGADPAALYGGLASPYEFKGLPTAAGLYPYDPALAAYPYAAGFLDPNARRKNATRESTQTLKAWLTEHKKNPYPTKGEKIMLAIITKMTLTQVSTWFANARRRLKKENKMTWEPRNRMDDEDDDINSDIEDNDKKDGEDENISVDSDDDDDITHLRHNPLTVSLAQQLSAGAHLAMRPNFITAVTPSHMSLAPSHIHQQSSPVNNNTDSRTSDNNKSESVKDNETKRESSSTARSSSESSDSSNKESQRPKIWSMAEIATSSSKTDTESNTNSQSPNHNKIPSIISQGLHPAWRGAHPYLHPHLAHRMAAFPGGQHPPQHIAIAGQRAPVLPAFTSLPQLRHTDSANRMSAFSPPASATSPSTQAQRNV